MAPPSDPDETPPASGRLLARLMPPLAAVAFTYLLTGVSFAAIPLFVARDLGQGPALVGTLTGLSFLFAIVTRLWAGGLADRRGPKPTLLMGLAAAGLSGLACVAAVMVQEQTALCIALVIAARVLLGGAEAIVVVSGQTWALAAAGPGRSAMAVGWIGTALFVAMAAGAPVGGALYGWLGFGAVGLAMALAPVPVMAVLWRLRGPQSQPGAALVIGDVARRIAVFCIAVALAGVGYGAIVSFCVLLFEERGWQPPWVGLTLFSAALVVTRVAAGSLPDRVGGVRAALGSLGVMVAGFALLALSGVVWLGWIGAVLAGIGYSLVYPALAREALERVPARNRGSAMALFSGSINLVLGLGVPAMGLLAEAQGNGAVFMLAALAALVSGGIVVGTASARP